MVSKTIVYLIIFLFISTLIVLILDFLMTFKINLKNSIIWKQYRGVYVLAKIVRYDKKNEIYYFDKVTETMSSASSSIKNAIKFKNQDQALKFLLENYIEGMFILKI